MTRREQFVLAYTTLQRLIEGLSGGEIDSEWRGRALEALNEVRKQIISGLNAREVERAKEEEAAIIKAYREGRLTGTL